MQWVSYIAYWQNIILDVLTKYLSEHNILCYDIENKENQMEQESSATEL